MMNSAAVFSAFKLFNLVLYSRKGYDSTQELETAAP
jgi:hypothetical protein